LDKELFGYAVKYVVTFSSAGILVTILMCDLCFLSGKCPVFFQLFLFPLHSLYTKTKSTFLSLVYNGMVNYTLTLKIKLGKIINNKINKK
jgi:hypothetical protein